jgi:DNA-binding response OmpR family regulator
MSIAPDREPEEDALATYGFARVLIDRPAGQLLAAMSEGGAWMVRIRRGGGEPWRLACTGDIDSLAVETDLPRETTEGRLVAGALIIDLEGRRVLIDGEEVGLARKEFDCLAFLARSPGRVNRKEDIMRAVWGRDDPARRRTVDSTISRLRRKLAAAGAGVRILNSWGSGYSLVPESGRDDA